MMIATSRKAARFGRRAVSSVVRAIERAHIQEQARDTWNAVRPPMWPGMRLTPKRLLNYWMVRYQWWRGHVKLRGYPLVLTLEANSACNLRCPHCFTGVGEVGRERSLMPMPLYQKIIDELGDYALHVELHNWGEPLLNKNIYEMLRIANDRGLSTLLSTNFSMPFNDEKAEKLVNSGLDLLGFGFDGATQEAYEQYRVGGNLERALGNVRTLLDAKKRLGSKTPHLAWSFHVFEWNYHEVETARKMAEELGVAFAPTKGWVSGPEWDPAAEFEFPGTDPSTERCKYLWTQAIVNNDGGTAPCCMTFYREDDLGVVGDLRFRDVWNNQRFQDARRLFKSRADAPERAKDLVCHDCPYTITWENYQQHLKHGGTHDSFDPGYTTNDWFNYFFQRRYSRDPDQPGDVIELRPLDEKTET